MNLVEEQRQDKPDTTNMTDIFPGKNLRERGTLTGEAVFPRKSFRCTRAPDFPPFPVAAAVTENSVLDRH